MNNHTLTLCRDGSKFYCPNDMLMYGRIWNTAREGAEETGGCLHCSDPEHLNDLDQEVENLMKEYEERLYRENSEGSEVF